MSLPIMPRSGHPQEGSRMPDFGQRTDTRSYRTRRRGATPRWITPEYPINSGPWTVPVSPDPPQSSPPARLILDISRLVYAAWSRTPKGIPRVELAYAEHFLASQPDRLHFTVLDAFGRLRIVNNRPAAAFTRAIARYWEGGTTSITAHWRVALRAFWIHIVLMMRPWGDIEQLVTAQRGRVHYIIPSQLHLERASLIRKLKNAGDLKLVVFVHDILPSLLPDYFTEEDAELYHRRMENAARLADIILVNSETTSDSFRTRFGDELGSRIPVVAPLGVALHRCAGPAAAVLPQQPYFVMLGTIEPRKNHKLILDVWLELHRELGPSTPRLLVVGERGWKSRDAIDLLERNGALHGFVEECGRLPDATVAGLLKDACALLLPSFAEGYGLPLAEALTQGAPVLCSDIPVFREVGGDIPDYLDPTDGLAWHAAVVEYAQPRSPKREAQIRRLTSWSAPTWEQHFAVVDSVLRKL
ncbi:glycosyltransferase family 1 protein [Reyranella sp.]|uniref:glycosyltransferase family 4 protein n=1 Tax=Reyranella sp. TaxID=1929291 RepID=UPI0025FFFAF2|nr:glycosyltransferase family 1 protein [Reyranella sp.]